MLEIDPQTSIQFKVARAKKKKGRVEQANLGLGRGVTGPQAALAPRP